MLFMNDLKLGMTISMDGQPYVIQYTQHVQMGRGSAVLRTKLKNLLTGNVLERTFKSGDKVEEADLSHQPVNFLYADSDTCTFMNNETYDQFTLPKDQIGPVADYIQEGTDVDVLYYEGKPVAVKLPLKVELDVLETEPGTRGDTAQGRVMKPAKVSTGLTVQVPLFVKTGDRIRVNTESGAYVERVN
jgi:elongation factor P